MHTPDTSWSSRRLIDYLNFISSVRTHDFTLSLFLIRLWAHFNRGIISKNQLTTQEAHLFHWLEENRTHNPPPQFYLHRRDCPLYVSREFPKKVAFVSQLLLHHILEESACGTESYAYTFDSAVLVVRPICSFPQSNDEYTYSYTMGMDHSTSYTYPYSKTKTKQTD